MLVKGDINVNNWILKSPHNENLINYSSLMELANERRIWQSIINYVWLEDQPHSCKSHNSISGHAFSV